MKKIKQTAFIMLIAVFAINIANAQCPSPSGLAATSINANSSQLNWAIAGGATSYLIEVQNGQNNPVPFLVTGSSVTNTFTVNGLTGGFVYKFKVRTRCGGNKSNWSNWFSFAAGGGAINCVALTGLTVSNTTATGATFDWNASTGGLGYSVRVEDASGNPLPFLFNANTTANTYNMTGLNPSSNYKVKIRKRCAPGVNGPWSSWVFFTTTALRNSSEIINTTDNASIKVYPNPANDFIQISLTDDNEITAYQIFDVTGKLIMNETVSEFNDNKSFIISTTTIENGIYQLNLQLTDQIVSKKVVISR